MITTECLDIGVFITVDDGENNIRCLSLGTDTSKSVSKPSEDEDINLCESFCPPSCCSFKEKVHPGNTTYFYSAKKTNSDTVKWFIVKKLWTGKEISRVEITDQTYGEWVENEYFFLDWSSVFASGLKGGQFHIEIESNIVGVEKVEKSHTFCLSAFDICETLFQVEFKFSISGTVRDGRVFDPPRNYEIRIPGIISEQTPEEENEPYTQNNFKRRMSQKKVDRQYKFSSEDINDDIRDFILKSMVFADEFYVTYRTNNRKSYVDYPMFMIKTENLNEILQSSYSTIELNFVDLYENNVKRSCTQ